MQINTLLQPTVGADLSAWGAHRRALADKSAVRQ